MSPVGEVAEAAAPAAPEATGIDRVAAKSPFGAPSPHAGLWLLIPALAQIGIADIVADSCALPLRLLHAVAARLGIAADDPVLRALPVPDGEPAPIGDWLAPALWADLAAARPGGDPRFAITPTGRRELLTGAGGRLALGLGPRPIAARASRLLGAHGVGKNRRRRSVAADTLLLVAAQLGLGRHLRRHAGMGVRALAAWPGRVAASTTHVDVTFAFRDVRIGPRLAGLDLDPGWVPWLGRVVSFHYRMAEELAG